MIVFRENLAELEAISKTQLTCAWPNQKSSVQDKYKAVPVKDMPCIVAKANNRKMDLSDDSVCSETSILEYSIKNCLTLQLQNIIKNICAGFNIV